MEGVYAGGDVVAFPFPQRNNKKVNIPHWQMAHVHGASGGGVKHLSQHTVLISGQRRARG